MPDQASATADPQLRESLIATTCEAWRKRLIDPSRRNNLLFYRPVATSSLDLPASPELLEIVASQRTIEIDEILTAEQATASASAIRAIARKGLENFEEKGLSTLYIALGKCSWTADDGGRDPFAPIILFPVNMKLKGQDVSSTQIEFAGKPDINPALLHVLNDELNVKISAEEILQSFSPKLAEGFAESDQDDAESDGDEVSLDAVLSLLVVRGAKIPGFKAEPFAVIGNFSFQKLAMVKDLENRTTELNGNDIVAAIAGDAAARRALSAAHVEVDPSGLDSVPPANEFAVMEADSSQQCAISGIVAGQSAVVHGPPGTGKSQTITNLIATLAATGKKILFVAEKRAALEVVMNRLMSVGLDHLVIDLHGADRTPKKVMERVANTLNMVRESAIPASDKIHADYVDRRDRLNKHDDRMHRKHAPTGLSVYEMQGRLLRLPAAVISTIRWRDADLNLITENRAAQIRDQLAEATGFESLFNLTDPSPWCGVQLHDARAAQDALDLFSRLAYEGLPQLMESLAQITKHAGFKMPADLAEAGQVLVHLAGANQAISRYRQEVFHEAQSLVDAIGPGCAAGLAGWWARLTDANVRKAYKRALSLRRDGKASWRQVKDELQEASSAYKFWQDHSSEQESPNSIDGVDSCKRLYEQVGNGLKDAERICNRNFSSLPIQELLALVQAFAADATTPYRVSRICEIEHDLNQLGVQRMVAEIRATRRPANEWVALFDYIWLRSSLDMAALGDPGVQAFVGSTHNGYLQDFKTLDLKRLEVAATRVRREHAMHAVAAMNKFPDQESYIRSEAAKSMRHKPLRKTFAETSEVLTAVCPCWMASPLSVSQLINSTGIFDYVVFDEASQILSEDAIPAILRGKHVIVAGDNNQLPPTTFFAAADDDDESEDDATGYESLLDMMIPFVKGFHLNWHYRSHDEALIAFSNHHVYDDRLVTFPGAGTGAAISHVYVNDIPTSDGQEQSSGKEVEKVVQLVLEHARKTPDLSLGVITMGIKHAYRVQAALDRELNGNSEFAEFFDTGRKERFFIKNLERVQGDERDVIILSVGYGKDRADNLPLRFGPILGVNGKRRLNVAATRAKERVIVVSSFLYSDINSFQVKPGTGLEFLKNYLEYACSGGRLLTNGHLTTEPMNDFELDVQEALSSQGIVLVPQLGCSSFRIDFAACHPTEPGRYVLAIECDGATYHSSYTARDRDRLRQQQLERLGWTFHRIWSTDWFLRRNEEIKRAVEAFHRAVQKSDENGNSGGNGGQIAPHKQPSVPAATTSSRSQPKPFIPALKSIDEYSSSVLRNLLHWVKSDGKLRTNDELVAEIFAELPFARRGSRIDAAIRAVIAAG